MTSKSKKQHDFMEAVAHSPEFAKEVDVPQSVGQDFAKADDAAGITKSHSTKSRHPGDKRNTEETRKGRHAKNRGHKVRNPW